MEIKLFFIGRLNWRIRGKTEYQGKKFAVGSSILAPFEEPLKVLRFYSHNLPFYVLFLWQGTCLKQTSKFSLPSWAPFNTQETNFEHLQKFNLNSFFSKYSPFNPNFIHSQPIKKTYRQNWHTIIRNLLPTFICEKLMMENSK